MNFEKAKVQFPHRYTMEHIPAWASKPLPNGKYPAPQYKTDREWFKNTEFYDPKKPVSEQHATKNSCYSKNLSWPMGLYLDKPLRG